MSYTPHLPSTLNACIKLPASKSLSNRALLLCALSGTQSVVRNQSVCDDTRVMRQGLEAPRQAKVDIGAAGTAMRFLTAYFAATPGTDHLLTGTERMRQRPIGVLVDALRSLGADIEYAENEGFPPLRIHGRTLQGGTLRLPAHISSQYISALLMVAPLMEEGLTLQLEGDIISRPYIDMTLQLMQHFGASAGWTDERTLHTAPGRYTDGTLFTVESDWSAASYWYELVALSPDPNARIALPHLTAQSLQGDSAVRHYFEALGVHTVFDDTLPGAVLTRTARRPDVTDGMFNLDLTATPDLAQTLVVTCALLRQPFRFTGLQSLRIKETDRMAALQNELRRLGFDLMIEGDDTLTIEHYTDAMPPTAAPSIATYHDHRMAMAFAPAALFYQALTIENPEVVIKSYPDFWKNLQSLFHS